MIFHYACDSLYRLDCEEKVQIVPFRNSLSSQADVLMGCCRQWYGKKSEKFVMPYIFSGEEGE